MKDPKNMVSYSTKGGDIVMEWDQSSRKSLVALGRAIDEALIKERAKCRAKCIAIVASMETDGHPELVGDPDVPTPITNALKALNT